MPYKTKGNRLVNEVTLGDGYPLSSNLKPLKVGGKTSPIEMASAYPDDSVDAKVKVVGDLEVTGTTNIDTVGALDSGSITSGFGAIDNGASDIDTTGTVTGGAVTALGAESGDAILKLLADEHDDAGDAWNIKHEASDNTLRFGNDIGTKNIFATHATFTPNATVTNSNATFHGRLESVTGVCSGTGALDTGSSTIDTTGAVSTGALTCTTIDTGQGANEVYDMDQNVKTDSTVGFSEITSGAVIWQYFPFVTQLQTSANGHYFRDYDDTVSPHEKWDAYDSDMVIGYRFIHGFFCVPEDCTLVAWRGLVANAAGTANPTISVYHATPETDTGDTTFALAGSASVVSIASARLAVGYSGTCDVDLSAGDLVVPTIKHDDGSAQSYVGSITLKFITR